MPEPTDASVQVRTTMSRDNGARTATLHIEVAGYPLGHLTGPSTTSIWFAPSSGGRPRWR